MRFPSYLKDRRPSLLSLMLSAPSCLKVALATTSNIVLNALTWGSYVWLEGRVGRGVFRNWARRFRYTPMKFVHDMHTYRVRMIREGILVVDLTRFK